MQGVAQLPGGLLGAFLCHVLKKETFPYQPGIWEGKTHTSSIGSHGNTNFLTGSHKLPTVLHSESIRVFLFLPEIGDIACGPGDWAASPAYMPALHTPDRSKDVTPAFSKHSLT